MEYHGFTMVSFLIRTSWSQRVLDRSSRLFAACHVLHRLITPRNPPCALISLTMSLLSIWLQFKIALRLLKFNQKSNNELEHWCSISFNFVSMQLSRYAKPIVLFTPGIARCIKFWWGVFKRKIAITTCLLALTSRDNKRSLKTE